MIRLSSDRVSVLFRRRLAHLHLLESRRKNFAGFETGLTAPAARPAADSSREGGCARLAKSTSLLAIRLSHAYLSRRDSHKAFQLLSAAAARDNALLREALIVSAIIVYTKPFSDDTDPRLAGCPMMAYEMCGLQHIMPAAAATARLRLRATFETLQFTRKVYGPDDY